MPVNRLLLTVYCCLLLNVTVLSQEQDTTRRPADTPTPVVRTQDSVRVVAPVRRDTTRRVRVRPVDTTVVARDTATADSVNASAVTQARPPERE